MKYLSLFGQLSLLSIASLTLGCEGQTANLGPQDGGDDAGIADTPQFADMGPRTDGGYCWDAGMPIDEASNRTISFQLVNSTMETFYFPISGQGCEAFEVSREGMVYNRRTYAAYYCSGVPLGPVAVKQYIAIGPGDTYSYQWDAREFKEHSFCFDCRQTGQGSHNERVVEVASGYHQLAQAGSYQLRLNYRKTPPTDCQEDSSNPGLWLCPVPMTGHGHTGPAPTYTSLCEGSPLSLRTDFQVSSGGDQQILVEIGRD